MNKSRKVESSRVKASRPRPGRPRWWLVLVLLAAGLGVFAWMHFGKSTVEKKYVPRPPGLLTFNKNIAPIVFSQCIGCHRAGQSGPFTLLNFAEVKKHMKEIAEVTTRRFMPPWLPEHGFGEFIGERRLSVNQIGMIQQWVAEGAVEGAAADLPAIPQWPDGWQLGPPDLVVTMPQAYTLAAEGRDVYRNFVVPIPTTGTRYVRGIEFHPGNAKIVHHAFVKIDRTAQSRLLDKQDVEPGFPGMSGPGEIPNGHFLGWQPGRMPAMGREGLAWRLEPGTDLVLQMHLNPSGKPETIQSSLGLYFTDQPPTNTCFKVPLTSWAINIPAGETNHVIEDSYVLPVDVAVLAVLPHAHYLAKEMKGWATLPDGTEQPLLYIKQWDFNWQGDYRYVTPPLLPKGTILSMRFTYDNSTNNARNPNHPPRRILHGLQSQDEMCELSFQLLPRNPGELALLENDFEAKKDKILFAYQEHLVRVDPNDDQARIHLGLHHYSAGRFSEAARHWRAAIQVKPALDTPHYYLGLMFRRQNNLLEAQLEFATTLQLNPANAKAHGNLGLMYLEQGNLDQARFHFENALRLNPDDTLAAEQLKAIRMARKSQGEN